MPWIWIRREIVTVVEDLTTWYGTVRDKLWTKEGGWNTRTIIIIDRAI